MSPVAPANAFSALSAAERDEPAAALPISALTVRKICVRRMRESIRRWVAGLSEQVAQVGNPVSAKFGDRREAVWEELVATGPSLVEHLVGAYLTLPVESRPDGHGHRRRAARVVPPRPPRGRATTARADTRPDTPGAETTTTSSGAPSSGAR